MLPLWNFFLEKKQFTTLVISALILWGGAAAVYITKESAPEVQIPIGIVGTILPGASPEDVERLVTDPLESRLANLSGLNKLTSQSRSGVSIITAEFDASADIDKSIQKLRDEVDKAQGELPSEAEDPSVSDVNFVDQPIQLVSVSVDVPFSEFAKLSEELQDELQSVNGVSRVDVSGVREREIQILVHKDALERYGISLSQVTSAIASANASLPVGSIAVNGTDYNVSFEGDFDDVHDIGTVPILSQNGIPLYVHDIATISDGVEKATSHSRIAAEGRPSAPAMTLAVYKVRGEDVTTVTEGVVEKIESLKETLLAGSVVRISNDLGDQVKKDLTQLTRTGIETMFLVMICLFITIGWRESIIAGLSIPLSFLIAFIGLLYSGNTLNFVSLFSLILAIGILVDSGIVVVEAIHTRSRILKDRDEAARLALKEYAWPLIGGTLTTVVVFIPLFFISGIVGEFIASIPYTVIFVLFASIFVALGLIPYLAVRFTHTNHSPLMDKQEAYAQKGREWYARFLTRILENRRIQNRFFLALGIGFVLALALPITGLLKVDFFPQEDIDFLYVDIELPPGTTLERTDLAARQVEEALYNLPEIDSLVTTVGSLSAFSSAQVSGIQSSGPRYANLTVNLADNREHTSSEILTTVKERLKPIESADIRAGQPTGGPPVGAPILLKFLGEDREALDQMLNAARRELEQTEGATDIQASNKNDAVEYTLSIDRNRLAQTGLSPAQIGPVLRTAIAGVEATSIRDGDNEVVVRVLLNLNPANTDPHTANVATIDAVRSIPIPLPSGGSILLGSVLTEEIGRSTAVIQHEDRKRVATLSASTLPEYTPPEVLAAFEDRMARITMPDGVEMLAGGENEETDQSFKEMFFALIAGIGLMYVILVLAFNSHRYSTFLLLTVPLSLIGVLFGLTFARQALSFPSLLGVIALAGVIINHAIILMDSIIQRMKTTEGRGLKEIIVESAVTRLRPIFLTTITTVVGMIPLIEASPLWGPLAFAILFGLSFAMVLTLILIPVLVYRFPGKDARALKRN